jgi:RecA-family ATPase
MSDLEKLLETADDPPPPRQSRAPVSMMSVALHFAGMGWSVFPCDPETKKPLTPRDRDPITNEPIPGTGGLKKASCDGDQIRARWKKHPNAMVGLPTGKEVGFFVLEIDVADKNGTPYTTVEKQISAIEAELGDKLPPTMRVRTPRGGEHWYYWSDCGYPRNSASIERGGKKLQGVDMRGDGGYVIAAGSIRDDGKAYVLVDDRNIALAPKELVDWACARDRWAPSKPNATTSTPNRANGSSHPSAHPHEAYAKRAFESEIAKLATTPEGGRNEQIFKTAAALADFVPHGLLTESEIRRAIETIISGWSDFPKSRDTMESGIRKGLANPRELPEPQPPKSEDRSRTRQSNHDSRSEETESTEPVRPLETFSAAEFEGVEPPPRRWLVKDRIPIGAVTLLAGDGAAGKTTIALQLCVAVAGKLSGWLNGLVEEFGPALFLTAEEDKNEVHYRLGAIVKHHSVSYPPDLHIYCATELDPQLAAPKGKFGKLEITRLYEALRLRLEALRAKLVVLESSADLFGGDEINKTQVRQFITYLRKLARDFDCAILLLSHPSIRGMNDGTGTSGNTAWSNSVRARMYFQAVEDSPSLRKLEIKKSNYGPVGEVITVAWRDGVYVPEPKSGSFEREAADQKVEELFLTLLRRLDGQGRRVTNTVNSTAYAPTVFADEPEAKGLSQAKKTFTEAMKRLFAASRIRVGKDKTGAPSKRKERLEEVKAEEKGEK